MFLANGRYEKHSVVSLFDYGDVEMLGRTNHFGG